jgi:predicted metal-dependent hydrolase
MSETLEVGGLRFEVRRGSRRKTLGLTVDRGAELVIRAPTVASEDELARWARSKLLWVHRKLTLKAELEPKVREPEYVTGEIFRYLGRSYRLRVTGAPGVPLRFDGRCFLLQAVARTSASDHFRRWYISTGRPWIERRARLLGQRVGAVPARVKVGDLGFRWGSCGRNGVVFFNWRLLQLPVRVADYVIAHELSHLLAPHHRPDFWHVLDRSMPDWKEREEELRRKAQEVYWCTGTMVQ